MVVRIFPRHGGGAEFGLAARRARRFPRGVFSKRFDGWRLEDNALAVAAARRRAEGLEVLDLTVANPSRVGLAWEAEALARALGAAENRFYEPEPRGLRACREHVAAHYLAHGAAVAPENIFLCASTSEGYAWAVKLLADPGDEILVPAPSYPLLQFLAGMENVSLAPYPLRFAAGRWRVDADALAAAVSPRTRAIFCVTPNNPTGSVLDSADRDALRAAALRHNLALIVDEVFLDFPADGVAAGATAADGALASWAGEAEVPLLALNGMSKLALLPQIKLAWSAVGGSPAWRAQACRRLELIADTYLSVNTPAQHAAATLFAEGARQAGSLRARVRQNERHLREWCAAAAHRPRLLPREAGWTAMLALPAGVDEERATLDLLRRGGVLVHPGYFYDTPAAPTAPAATPDSPATAATPAAFWVVSLIVPEASLLRALPRLEETLRRV